MGCIIAYAEEESLTILKKITYQKIDKDLEVIMELEGKFDYDVFELYVPPRLVVDFWRIQEILVEPIIDISEVGVLKIRVGEYQPQVARVVFDLNKVIPSYNVVKIENGLKIIFSLEKIPEKIEKKVKPEKVEKIELPPKKVVKKVEKEIPEKVPEKKIKKGYFIKGSSGLGLFLRPALSVQKNFVIYGEDGFIKEDYKFKTNLIFEINAGKYFNVFNKIVKGGIGFTYWSIGHDGDFRISLPHPFISNSPREVDFAEKFKNKLYNFYIYGLISIFEKYNFQILMGPILGYSNGKITTLENLAIEEKAPFTSSDISISSKSYIDDEISSLWSGLAVNFEYSIYESLSLVMDTKFIYLNPKVNNLGKRANYLQLQTILGIQYKFSKIFP
jgi:hypothetical protein